MKGRTTPPDIKKVPEGEIFVFGSNRSGIHRSGAAKKAIEDLGAIFKQPEGLQGRTYAIPTKDFNVKDKLPLEDIQMHVDLFLEVAKQRPDLKFLVTEIGCGYAGYKPSQIAPLFKEAADIENICLPESFWQVINEV